MSSGAEPIVFTTFIQPPDEAPLVEIKQMLQYTLDLVNDFHLAIFTLQESYPLKDALSVISDLRSAMSSQCHALEIAYTSVADCARVYSVIPAELSSNRQQAENHRSYIKTRTGYLAVRFRDADTGITTGAHQFRQAAGKMYSALGAIDSAPNDDDAKSFLFKAKNPQVAGDLLQAFQRAATASRKLADYYNTLNEHLQSLEGQMDTLQPPPEEVEITGRRWNEHREQCEQLMVNLTKIGLYMDKSQPYELPSKPPYQSILATLPTPHIKTTPPRAQPAQPISTPDSPEGRSAQPQISDAVLTVPANAADSHSSSSLPATKNAAGDKASPPLAILPPPRPSFLKRILKRFLPCIRSKYFQD